MTREFSFLHIADIHLGRAFSDISLYNENMSLCKDACKKAFNKIVETAIKKSVNFVLIAGDSFDSDEHDLHTKLVFKKNLERLADNGIPSYVICGNHDPINMYMDYPSYFKFDEKYKNLIHITGVTTKTNSEDFLYENLAKIHSVSFQTDTMENPCNLLTERDTEFFNIGLIHCDLNKTDTKYAPCSVQDMKELGYDYYALGHIHLPSIIEDKFVYSGTIQGRTRKETDEHGCYYIKVKDNDILEKEFIKTDCVRFIDLDINLDDEQNSCENKFEIFEKINNKINELPQEVELYLIQINLKGVTPASIELKETANILEEYTTEYSKANSLVVYEINDFTTPEIDEKELLEDDGVIGILAKNLNDDFNKNIDSIYDEIKEKYKKIYKSFGIDKTSEEELFNSLTEDKETIMAQIKSELKTLCSEIYKN